MSKHAFKINKNTDATDIENQCLGLSTSIGRVNSLNNKRGLHIQIRHNRDKQTFEAACELASLISAAPEMLEALSSAVDLICSKERIGAEELALMAKLTAAIKKATGN